MSIVTNGRVSTSDQKVSKEYGSNYEGINFSNAPWRKKDGKVAKGSKKTDR